MVQSQSRNRAPNLSLCPISPVTDAQVTAAAIDAGNGVDSTGDDTLANGIPLAQLFSAVNQCQRLGTGEGS